MADRSEPGQVRGQHYRPTPCDARVRVLGAGMICRRNEWQIMEVDDAIVLVGRICRRKQAGKDKACDRCAD